MISQFKFLRLFLIFISVVSLYTTINLRWGGDEKWIRIVQSDGRGYYGHLPAIFIYDLSYQYYYDVEQIKMAKLPDNYVRHADNYAYNKYYIGTAVMQTPFFLMGHFASFLANKPMDGYSKLYFKFINLGSLFYLIIGLWFLSKFLSFYRISELNLILTVAFIYFGTNLYYYAVHESSMSHVYSFSLFSAFSYYAHVFFHRFRKRYIIYLGALIGLIAIVRPINVIIILSLPIFAGNFQMLKLGIDKLRHNWLVTFLGFFVGFAVIFIQFLEYKIGTGHWWIYSYNAEGGFDWSGRNMLNFLISYKKGLFVYSPMYLMAILLGFYALKVDRFRFIAWALFLVVVVYVLSAWSQWWYGGSFSSRVMVEFLPFFALPLAFGLQSIGSPWKKWPLTVFLILIVVLCLIQTYQYHWGMIHYVDMDKDWYWRVFLKI